MKGLTTVYDSKYHQKHWDGRRRDSVVAGFTTALDKYTVHER
jgi:hypothetical protein